MESKSLSSSLWGNKRYKFSPLDPILVIEDLL
jgi:hypothetical protein